MPSAVWLTTPHLYRLQLRLIAPHCCLGSNTWTKRGLTSCGAQRRCCWQCCQDCHFWRLAHQANCGQGAGDERVGVRVIPPSLPLPPPSDSRPLAHNLPGEPVFRVDSLGSTAGTSLGPHTPPSRALSTHLNQGWQTAVRRYETQLQPTQVRVVSQTAEGTHNGRGSTHPSRGNHEAELAGFNRQHRKAAQSHLGFASPHVKALVGEVMLVDHFMGNDTHQLFCQICRNHQWSYYIDVRGD